MMYDNYSMIIRPNVESADVLIEAPSKDQFEEELESYLRFFIISILRHMILIIFFTEILEIPPFM